MEDKETQKEKAEEVREEKVEKAVEAELVSSTSHTTASPKSNNSGMKAAIIVVVVLLVLCICCVVGCFATGYWATIQTSLGLSTVVNEAIEEAESLSNFDVDLKDVETSGDTYVLTLEIKNNGQTSTFSTLLYLTLVDESGNEYSQDFFYELAEGQQLDQEIESGETVVGQVAFEVDANPSSLTLRVLDSVFSDKYEEFEVK